MVIRRGKYSSDKGFKLILEGYRQELEEARNQENIKRCRILALGLLVINILLLFIDIFIYLPMRYDTPAYLYLYLSRLIVLIALSLWLISLEIRKRYYKLTNLQGWINSLFLIVILWCIFMGINSTRITGGIIAYVICMFCFAAAYYVSPLEAFVIHFISSLVFVVGLVLTTDEPKLLYSNIVNTIITLVLVQITSVLNYHAFAKDFVNKKDILHSKEELEVVNKKLKEYEALRTDFFSNISHELRTPLNVIFSALQMIEFTEQNKQYIDAKSLKYRNIIKQNTYRLLRLINNLIDITKIDAASFSITPVNVDIVKTVEDITLSVADYIQDKGIRLTFDTEVEEKIIACDPDNIERIILNLLSNAVKYGKENGTILVNLFLEDGSVCISVKDDGPGIAEEAQDMIFRRFVQTDSSIRRRVEGSGIGLSLVKSLAEIHGGRITIKSVLGQGSEFTVFLPDSKLPEQSQFINQEPSECSPINRINVEFSDIYDINSKVS